MSFIPFAPPNIDKLEIEAVVEVLNSGWITTGPQVSLFEQEFSDFIGVSRGIAVNSWTSGAFICLKSLGIKQGDEVIVPTFTFCSTANVVEHVGAKPVFVDVEADTLNICPIAVEKAITIHTKAIFVVHYGGHPANLEALRFIAKKYNLYIIEDAAHGLPAFYKGEKIGSYGNPVIFSFYATKNLTTAEGGMILGEGEWMDVAKKMSWHGISKEFANRYAPQGKWYYEVEMPGYKCNMTDIQAAMGRVQLKQLMDFHERRRKIVTHYQSAFEKIEYLVCPVEKKEVESSWHLYPLQIQHPKWKRDTFLEALNNKGIGTSVHFIPLHLHPYYKQKYGYKPTDFPIALHAFQQIFSLPLHPKLSMEHQNRIIETVIELLEEN